MVPFNDLRSIGHWMKYKIHWKQLWIRVYIRNNHALVCLQARSNGLSGRLVSFWWRNHDRGKGAPALYMPPPPNKETKKRQRQIKRKGEVT